MSRHADTIAALATPTGTAALAIVRASGPDTLAIVTALCGAPPPPRVARHADYHARDGRLIDDVLITFFPGPGSYTGEDSLEVSCHGNPFIAQKILEDLWARGCRPAEAGEFTQRAFLNGKMDLSQAEAVMDLIHARSERALVAANQQLRGGLARRMNGLIDELLGALAQIEAYIDFPDEDLPPEDRTLVAASINHIVLENNKLIVTSRYGELLREGIKTVIVGAPNAGKSSLLNRLVGRERALVSPEPGTTRDFIEERVLIGPHYFRLIDTAGINLLPGAVEKLGIEKTFERIAEADLILLVVDAQAGGTPLPSALREALDLAKLVVVMNKIDLVPDPTVETFSPTATCVAISALKEIGLERLRDVLSSKADGFCQEPNEQVAINARHGHALGQARDLLQSAVEKLAALEPIELVASDLRGALAAFGEVTGRIDNERMLDQLFATFCIGK
jgi:tRNA modification GTPase